jgi:sarcosine oxidase subunit beta
MSKRPTVVVVGGGALGLSTAFALTELGISDVTVIERSQIGSASSGLSVGVIEAQYLDAASIEVRAWSMGAFGRLERDHGLPITRNGYCRLGHTPAALDEFERSVAYQHELGIIDAVVLDRAALKQLVPDLETSDLEGAMYGPSSGYIDGHLFCSLLADLLRDRGAAVLTACGLHGAEETPDGSWRLETSRGLLRTDVVVNAAGAWAPRVAELLGTRAHVLPQRHQALVAFLPGRLAYTMPTVMDYVPGTGEEGLYFRHETFESVIAGLHTEEVLHDIVDPDDYGRSDEHDFMNAVASRLLHRLPSLAATRLGNTWAGIYPMSPDGRPAVGPYRDKPSVVAALGAGGSGVQAAPAIGRIVAEWIALGESRTIAAASALLPDRPSLRHAAAIQSGSLER